MKWTKRMATTDGLTGLANQQGIQAWIRHHDSSRNAEIRPALQTYIERDVRQLDAIRFKKLAGAAGSDRGIIVCRTDKKTNLPQQQSRPALAGFPKLAAKSDLTVGSPPIPTNTQLAGQTRSVP